MIGLPSFLRRKPKPARAPGAVAEEKAPPAPKRDKPPHFAGAAGEKTQDLLTGHDGERIGFRKPLDG
ncbi:MAG: hypothetical protein WAN43_13470 [Rhodomicrobium sp.]|jgi:hypothetical protein